MVKAAPFLTVETALEDLLSQEMEPDDVPPPSKQAKNQHKRVITSDSDVEMATDSEEDQEPTPRPRKNRNRSSSEEIDLGEDEHFRTPHTLKQKKIAAEIVTIDSSDLSELSSNSEDELENENKGKKKGKLSKVLNYHLTGYVDDSLLGTDC